jgi:hypothetical protein
MVNEEFIAANQNALKLKMSPQSLFAISPVVENVQGYTHDLWGSDPLLQRWRHLWEGDLVLGLCHSSVQEGDFVAILSGCPCPVVIRPKGKRFEFVGGVYIHGVNEGGLVDDFEKAR